MARKEVVLITGANGEIGHGLITHFGKQGNVRVIGLDTTPLDDLLRPYCHEFILDTMLLGWLILQYEIRTIYHLASILSTKAEFNPEAAHRVNVTGFSLTAKEIRNLVQEAFPAANITFEPDNNRQGIVDSWPAALDDTPARTDWGWQPDYNLIRAFQEYLIPNIVKRYAL